MRFRTFLPAMLFFVSACALMKPKESFWSGTKTEDEMRLDWARCKQENAGANLTQADQVALAKEYMKGKGYEILPTDEAERRDREAARPPR